MFGVFTNFGSRMIYMGWYLVDTFNAAITRSVRENCYNQGFESYVCERLGHTAYDIAQSYAPYAIFGVASLAVTGTALANRAYRQHQYQKYINKSDTELNVLSAEEITAFDVGRNAAVSPIYRSRAQFSANTWAHPNAYYAGFQAGRENNATLIHKVKTRLN